jgi:hypothetical protein
MTDIVTPAEIGGAIDPTQAGHAWANAGTGGWVVDGVELADNIPSLDSSGVNSFYLDSGDGLELTIHGGEAYVAGWLCRDRQTTYEFESNTTDFLCVGYDAGAILDEDDSPADNENIIIGTPDDFGDHDPYIELFEVETGSDSISNVSSVRSLEKPFDYDSSTGTARLTVDTEVDSDLEFTDGNSITSIREINGQDFGRISFGGNLWNFDFEDATGVRFRHDGEEETLRLEGTDVIIPDYAEVNMLDITQSSNTNGLRWRPNEEYGIRTGWNNNNDRWLIAPEVDGSGVWDKELSYRFDGSLFEGEYWQFDSPLNVEGDLTNDGDGTLRVTDEWDGSSMTLETTDGTEIEFISED